MTARRRWVPRILLLAFCIALGYGFGAAVATTPHIAVVDVTYSIEGN